jgi:hypothetical protein
MRAGINVLIVDASLVVALVLTARPFRERIRHGVATSPLAQRCNVFLSTKKISTSSTRFLVTALKFLRTNSVTVNATNVT